MFVHTPVHKNGPWPNILSLINQSINQSIKEAGFMMYAGHMIAIL